MGGVGGPCDFSVSPSPFGLDFGTLDYGTSDLGLTTRKTENGNDFCDFCLINKDQDQTLFNDSSGFINVAR